MKKLLVILLIILFVTSAFASWPYHNKPWLGLQVNKDHPLGDPVGLWLMNEGSGNKVLDLSGNDGTGIFDDTVINWDVGKTGPAVFFNGGEIDLPASYVPIDGASEFSFVARIKAASIPADRGIFYTESHTTADPVGLWIDNATPDHFACFINGSGGAGGPHYSDIIPVEGVWYDIVLTYNANDKLRLYVDGIEDTAGSFPADPKGTIDVTTTHYTIGADDGGLKAFVGLIEFSYLYNRSLSASEVALLKREPFCMFEQGDITTMFTYPTDGVVVTPYYYRGILFILIIPFGFCLWRRRCAA